MNDKTKNLVDRMVQSLIDQGKVPEESREYACECMRRELERAIGSHCRRVGQNVGLMLHGVSRGLIDSPVPVPAMVPMNN